MVPHTDICIIGAGAAGLTAAIFAARAQPRRSILVLDGAEKIGAKILVAGGGRCNVTHDVVDESAYSGSTRNAIRKVLRRLDVPHTVGWFRELGVDLKREDTGKLFPTTDSARTVLDALLRTAEAAGVKLAYPRRVECIERQEGGFVVSGAWGAIAVTKVVLATGGKSLPKSGSDGHGYVLAQSLGHSITPRLFPALVPLVLADGHFLRGLSGVSSDVILTVHSKGGKPLVRMAGSLLCTHFGISGPVVLDISRWYTDAKLDDPAAHLTINWLSDFTGETFESFAVAHPQQGVYKFLHERLPERLARALMEASGVTVGEQFGGLPRDRRRALAQQLTATPAPVVGDRGYTYAEVTAGGVPLSELRLDSLESRICPGLHLCGEICDVDGRIGGYNFQWAWSSGYVVGVSI